MIELTLKFRDLVMANVQAQVNDGPRQEMRLRARVIGLSADSILISLLDDVPMLAGHQIAIPIMAVPFVVTKVEPPPVKQGPDA